MLNKPTAEQSKCISVHLNIFIISTLLLKLLNVARNQFLHCRVGERVLPLSVCFKTTSQFFLRHYFFFVILKVFYVMVATEVLHFCRSKRIYIALLYFSLTKVMSQKWIDCHISCLQTIRSELQLWLEYTSNYLNQFKFKNFNIIWWLTYLIVLVCFATANFSIGDLYYWEI